MQQFIVIMKLIIELMPLLIQTVDAIEKAVPESGKGAMKLETVKSVMQSAYSTMTAVEVGFEQLWPSLSAVIAGIVKMRK